MVIISFHDRMIIWTPIDGNSCDWFADCFALASAVEHGAVLVTGDPGFRAVEHLVTIAWVQASGDAAFIKRSRTGNR
jgi:hypothetical protein